MGKYAEQHAQRERLYEAIFRLVKRMKPGQTIVRSRVKVTRGPRLKGYYTVFGMEMTGYAAAGEIFDAIMAGHEDVPSWALEAYDA